MIDKIIVAIVIIIAALYVGSKFYRHWKSLSNPERSMTCDSGCCGCSDSDCNDKPPKSL